MSLSNTTPLVLIRHGESEWNKQNLFCGWYDASLSEKGREDATKISAAALLKNNMQFDIAYCSALHRSQTTLDIILRKLNCNNIHKVMSWRLNERHYGDLTGYNKRQMADKYGEKQVQIWRRSYAEEPPKMTLNNPFYQNIRNNPNFLSIPEDKFPRAESLKMVLERVMPLWENVIMHQIVAGKRVLIVAHGTVIRSIVKHLENISDENISAVNIPNSIPCMYNFDLETRLPIHKVKFLAEENYLNAQMEKTASIGK